MNTLLTLAQIRYIKKSLDSLTNLCKRNKRIEPDRYIPTLRGFILNIKNIITIYRYEGTEVTRLIDDNLNKVENRIKYRLKPYFNLVQVRELNKLIKEYNGLVLKYYATNIPHYHYHYQKKISLSLDAYRARNISYTVAEGELTQEIVRLNYQILNNQKPVNNRCSFTLEQVRYFYQSHKKWLKNDCDFKEFLAEVESLTFEQVYNLINNIWADEIKWEEFISGEYLKHENQYYSDNYYCLTLEGEIESKDDCSFCEYSQEWTNDPVTVTTDRNNETWARSVADENAHYYQGDYYTYEALDEHGLRLDEDGYVTDEEYNEYVREYHSNTSPTFVIFNQDNDYRIGFEIEKEDISIKESINIDDFEYETDRKWRKEEDGSLSDYSGFELVSPCFSLDPQEIREYIEDNDTLIDHINADYSDSCGGHINLSKKDLTGEEFYETIKGYTPLIHALNYDRLNEHYCTPASVNKLKQDKRKYQSIAIWDNRIELRIFSAVESVDQLIWRAELMRLICDNPTDCFKTAFYNVHTVLKDHLMEGYRKNYFYDYDHFDLFIEEIITQCKKHENIDLTNA